MLSRTPGLAQNLATFKISLPDVCGTTYACMENIHFFFFICMNASRSLEAVETRFMKKQS